MIPNKYVVVNKDVDGFNVVVLVHPTLGHLCGYVSVPKELQDILEENTIDCHGGITFRDTFSHIEGFEDSTNEYIGFDCAHAGDKPDPDILKKFAIKPVHLPYPPEISRIWTVDNVINECSKIIQQLKNYTTHLIGEQK